MHTPKHIITPDKIWDPLEGQRFFISRHPAIIEIGGKKDFMVRWQGYDVPLFYATCLDCVQRWARKRFTELSIDGEPIRTLAQIIQRQQIR